MALSGQARASPLLPVLGHIDEPDGRTPMVKGSLVVRGWAVGRSSPVSSVEIWLNGRQQGYAGLGRPRSDVATALQSEDAELSGFDFRIDLSRVGPLGERAVLNARVRLLDGTLADLSSVPIPIVPAIDPLLSPAAGSPLQSLPQPPRQRSSHPRVRLLCFARSLDYGGSQLRMREVMQHLRRTARFDITVVSPADGPLRRDLEAAGVVVRVAPMPFDDFGAYEENLARIADWAAGNFDVVLAFTLTSFAGIDLAWRLGLPSIWRIGESASVATVVEWLGGRIDPGVERRADSCFDLASVVLFISEASLRSRRQRGSPGRFLVDGNGVDVAAARAYMQATDREVCRQNLGIGPDQRVLICAATLWPIKGQHLLVSAMNVLRFRHPELTCVLIGQLSPYAEALSRFINRHHLADCVRIVPFCDDMRPWWRAADIAVCPSESEAMPTSALEAMAYGLPVLASRVDGLPEVVKDDLTGWLCEPRDLRSLIDGLERVATATPDHFRALGDAAMRLVKESHGRARILSRMSALLDRLSSGPPEAGVIRS
jgi:glycosyltransferase involved in cell wall biosynthesis